MSLSSLRKYKNVYIGNDQHYHPEDPPPEGYYTDVANLADLAAVDDATLRDATVAKVVTLLQEFTLSKTSLAPVDGITVVYADSAANNPANPGRWLRVLSHVPQWTKQLTWFVNPQAVGASDENKGDASGVPLKSLAEVTRRLRVVDAVAYTVNLLSDTLPSDTFDPSFSFSGENATNNVGSMTIIGQQTVVASGVIAGNGTDTLGTSPAGNQQAQVGADISLVAHVGKLGFMTSGALSGYQFAIGKSLSPNVARVGNFWLQGTAPAAGAGTFAAAGNGVGGAPQNGDTFEIRDLTNVNAFVRHAGLPIRFQVYWKNVTFTPSANLIVEGGDIRFATCRIICSLLSAAGKGQTFNGAFRMFGCLLAPVSGRITQFDCRVRFVGCTLLNTSFSVFNTGRGEIINTYVQGGQGGEGIAAGRAYTGFGADTAPTEGQLAVFSGTFGLGIFDVAGYGLRVVRGAKVSVDAPLYGSGNTKGCGVAEGGQLYKRTGLTMSLDGTTQQVELSNAATAIPALVAGAAVPAASPLATWADLAAAPFSGNVLDYKTGAAMLTVAPPV